ncbi:uncharacterized protein I303_107088 [Kwoniella dejecticola CBS 10117]|uniref:Nicotinamide mononucleotide permease n=1 Tax=Kwoniella dejecticola CBS 10117 TaxID=1296121 RepID=A0A1A5ZYP6_9TREE|nr:nicotinamide mononucleotide permease [Kwoniella dejecticola CBS 10117]OBR82931.1 nicotinamide mononucleotide permease [Kwoniella dejecticola CBS 10117]
MAAQHEDRASIKELEKHHEDVAAPYLGDNIDRHLAVQVPESLQGLSDEELDRIDKAATRKVDILLMPTLVALYILNYLDRQNISSAKIAGINKDLGLTTTDYNTAVSVLFAGYVSLQVPSNMLASKIAYPGIYICIMCAVWGVISACTGAVHSFAGLAVCRTFLGFAEAAFFPGAVYLVSTFYTKRSMALRTAILYSGSQIGNAFGGLFALAILELDGAHGLEGWRWLFIVEGILTVGLAAIFATFIPNKPQTIRWLTPQEKDRLQYRLEVDRGSKDATDEVSVGAAFKMAVTDPKTWLLCGCLQMNYIAASVTNFFPVVVNTLGFNRTITLAITCPPYILCCIAVVVNGWHSDKKNERALHIICPFIFTVIGNVIAVATTSVPARYFAMCILPSSFYSASIVILSWISSSVTGPAVKRAIVYAVINALCNTPNIWTSYLYFNAPKYTAAFGVDLAAAVGTILFAACTYLYLKRQNARLERGEDTGKHGPSAVQIEAGFRYQL